MQRQKLASYNKSPNPDYNGNSNSIKEPVSISLLHQVLPSSINNIPNFIGDKVYNTIIDRVTKSIVLTFENYIGNVWYGDSDNKYLSVIKYISALYNKTNIKNKEFIVYPNVSKDDKYLFKQLPTAGIQFICSDRCTICKVEFIDIAISGSDELVMNNKGVRISFIGKHASKYISIIYKIIRQKSINKSTLFESNYIYMQRSNGGSIKLYTNTFSDIILGGKEELIIEPLKKFLESKELYDRYNINYNLGCLLYGDPGCGKTSIFKAIIWLCKQYYTCSVYMLDLTVSLEVLHRSIDNISNTSYDGNINIVLMEEVDSIFPNDRNEIRDKEESNKLNMLLQVLDGTMTPKNTIFVATTNYYHKLDKAFKRDGRFNIKVEVTPFKEKEAMKMCDKFNVGYDILEGVEYPINPTTLQKMIFFNEYK